MSLAPGTRIGPYEVVSMIGVGGMGEVYRAHDTSLKRDVALKILPESLSGDPGRLGRFQREAEVLASLNHPNIAHVYGLEKADGRQALVMELVEGPTLADRIGERPIPLDEALLIAKQIAEALDAARERAIVHRDLKPANVKVKEDGTVRVLDFGLAKTFAPAAVSGDIANSPTLTSPAVTGQGVILGTAAYMAPEQARGKAVDKRADIWAFGVVLFEMLTGRRLFAGADVTETIALVVTGQPDLSQVPPAVKRLLGKCLEKDPSRRLRDIGDVWELLEHPAADGVPISAMWPRLLGIGGLVLTGAALGLIVWLVGVQRDAEPPPPIRFVDSLPDSATMPLGMGTYQMGRRSSTAGLQGPSRGASKSGIRLSRGSPPTRRTFRSGRCEPVTVWPAACGRR
jgi:serine/threonine-protein kinase